MRREPSYDLTPFEATMSWESRLSLIRRTFSSSVLMGATSAHTHEAWYRAFDRDPEFMGRILRDILKSEQAVPGRSGPRPSLDAARAEPIVDGWLGRDPTSRPYTTLPFSEALQLLAGERSLRHVASMTGVGHMTIHRLIRGDIEPNAEVMVKVAQAFQKQPSFFVEWRVGVIASAVVSNLKNMPERSVKAYEALFWDKGKDRNQVAVG